MRHARVAIALSTLLAATAGAQQDGPRPEVRLDATDGRPAAAQLLAGAVLPVGNYVRLTLSGGAGVAPATGSRPRTGSGRGEALVRFLLDPYRESRIGLSAGGGVTIRHEPGAGTRAYLALLVDVEGRPRGRGRLAPVLQLGLGGGARIGVAVRAIPPRRR